MLYIVQAASHGRLPRQIGLPHARALILAVSCRGGGDPTKRTVLVGLLVLVVVGVVLRLGLRSNDLMH